MSADDQTFGCKQEEGIPPPAPMRGNPLAYLGYPNMKQKTKDQQRTVYEG
jgi:hypothetical protein